MKAVLCIVCLFLIGCAARPEPTREQEIQVALEIVCRQVGLMWDE